MKSRNPKGTKGSGNLHLLIVLTLVGAGCYVGIKLGMPYYAYWSLRSTMKQWAKITLYRGDRNYDDLREKIQWTIERHKIPLDIKDVEIEYDAEEQALYVYAEYDVYVRFPGYVYHYFFQPYVEVSAKGD